MPCCPLLRRRVQTTNSSIDFYQKPQRHAVRDTRFIHFGKEKWGDDSRVRITAKKVFHPLGPGTARHHDYHPIIWILKCLFEKSVNRDFHLRHPPYNGNENPKEKNGALFFGKKSERDKVQTAASGIRNGTISNDTIPPYDHISSLSHKTFTLSGDTDHR